MEITADDYEALLPQLRDQGTVAPKEAVAALLAFQSGPESVITLEVSQPGAEGTSWLLVALTVGGLIVVTATCPSVGWNWDGGLEAEDEYELSADWYPLEAVDSVSLSGLQVSTGAQETETPPLHLEHGWTIRLSTREEPIALDRDPVLREGAVSDFCSRLMAARGAGTP